MKTDFNHRALVTGATGFLGRHLVTALLERGIRVVALVRNDGHKLPPEAEIRYGDITDLKSLTSAGAGCDLLFHLAGFVSFDPGLSEKLTRINGLGTENILLAAEKWGVRKSVVVSSACTLGLSYHKDAVLDERSVPGSVLAERNPYMKSKLASESAAAVASKTQDVVLVNPTTVYGPGDFSLNSGSLIKRIFDSCVIPVPPGGSNVIGVGDVVEGIMAASIKGKSGKKYILGGSNCSFASIFSQIASVVGKRPVMLPLYPWMAPPFSWGVSMAGKITGNRFLTRQIADDLFAYKYYSTRLAEDELGWAPRESFQDTLEKAWAFYRQQGLI